MNDIVVRDYCDVRGLTYRIAMCVLRLSLRVQLLYTCICLIRIWMIFIYEKIMESNCYANKCCGVKQYVCNESKCMESWRGTHIQTTWKLRWRNEWIRKGLSCSIMVGTRKTANYACAGWSQAKVWWKLEVILTCKLMIRREYRGERLIELSGSWFPAKFPSG